MFTQISPVLYQAKIPITFHNLLSPTFQTCCFQGVGPRWPSCFIMEQLVSLSLTSTGVPSPVTSTGVHWRLSTQLLLWSNFYALYTHHSSCPAAWDSPSCGWMWISPYMGKFPRADGTRREMNASLQLYWVLKRFPKGLTEGQRTSSLERAPFWILCSHLTKKKGQTLKNMYKNHDSPAEDA